MTLVRQYNTIEEAVKAANNLQSDGIANDEFFVLAHDDRVIDEVASRSEAEKPRMDDTGFGAALKNMFRSQGDELRRKMEELGLSSYEAESYEKQLDEGKVLLVFMDDLQDPNFQ
jgi:hypothetical protein